MSGAWTTRCRVGNCELRIAKNEFARRGGAVVILLAACLLFGGCVERTMKIDTDPQGARVFVNDEEVGLSPVKFSFLWYGDYDIVIRKEGYRTISTNHRVNAPWYQIPPFDLITETMILGTLRDEHVLPTYELEPLEEPEIAEVVQRATELRDRAMYQQ